MEAKFEKIICKYSACICVLLTIIFLYKVLSVYKSQHQNIITFMVM